MTSFFLPVFRGVPLHVPPWSSRFVAPSIDPVVPELQLLTSKAAARRGPSRWEWMLRSDVLWTEGFIEYLLLTLLLFSLYYPLSMN